MARGVRILIDLKDDGARLALRQLRNLGADPQEIMESWGGILESSARGRITVSNVGPDGVPWIPSKRVLGTAVGRHGPQRTTGKTLYDKGNLEASIRYVTTKNSVTVGVDGNSESSKHAADLQFGSNRTTVVVAHTRVQASAFGVPFPNGPREVKVRGHAMRTNLPARPFIGVSVEDKADMIDAGQEILRSKFK